LKEKRSKAKKKMNMKKQSLVSANFSAFVEARDAYLLRKDLSAWS
jgi:hypothetical protein